MPTAVVTCTWNVTVASFAAPPDAFSETRVPPSPLGSAQHEEKTFMFETGGAPPGSSGTATPLTFVEPATYVVLAGTLSLMPAVSVLLFPVFLTTSVYVITWPLPTPVPDAGLADFVITTTGAALIGNETSGLVALSPPSPVMV